MKKLLLLTLCLGLTFTSCNLSSKKEEKKETLLPENSEESLKRTTQETKNCRVFKPNERKKYKNAKKQNLDVLQGESYFNIKDKYFKIKIPVQNEKFKIYSCKIVNGDLVIGVSDKQEIGITGKLGNYILDKKILYADLSESVELGKKDSILVRVINDVRFSKIKSQNFTDTHIKKLIKNILDDPDEERGGVIIVGP